MSENGDVPYIESNLYRKRHSVAHVMAEAVLAYYPEAKLAIGPPIEDGFYYDFDLPRALTAEDLKVIEKRMKKIIKQGHVFKRKEVSADEARELFAGQQYKIELIDGLRPEKPEKPEEPVEPEEPEEPEDEARPAPAAD